MSTTIDKLRYLASITRFRRISEKLYVDGDKIYKEAGINFKASWFPVYYVLALAEAPVTVTEIANQIDFTHITVKNVIRELERAEYVSVETNPSDRRSKLISLSTKGLKQIYRLKPIWISISTSLKKVFQTGHPDFMNILNRIDTQIENNPFKTDPLPSESNQVIIVDYKPGLHKHLNNLTSSWLTGEINGQLEEEDETILQTPDEEHFSKGGFLFFARFKEQIVGFVALKRMDDDTFEFTRLYVNPDYRSLGIDKKLVERCISRCKENEATELWHQTNLNLHLAHHIYYSLGFTDKEAPSQMQVLDQTQKVLCLEL